MMAKASAASQPNPTSTQAATVITTVTASSGTDGSGPNRGTRRGRVHWHIRAANTGSSSPSCRPMSSSVRSSSWLSMARTFRAGAPDARTRGGGAERPHTTHVVPDRPHERAQSVRLYAGRVSFPAQPNSPAASAEPRRGVWPGASTRPLPGDESLSLLCPLGRGQIASYEPGRLEPADEREYLVGLTVQLTGRDPRSPKTCAITMKTLISDICRSL
jgi:hypothetical protein